MRSSVRVQQEKMILLDVSLLQSRQPGLGYVPLGVHQVLLDVLHELIHLGGKPTSIEVVLMMGIALCVLFCHLGIFPVLHVHIHVSKALAERAMLHVRAVLQTLVTQRVVTVFNKVVLGRSG